MRPVTDTTPFPFGKKKGTPCKDIPDNMYEWLMTQEWFADPEKFIELKAYFSKRIAGSASIPKDGLRSNGFRKEKVPDGTVEKVLGQLFNKIRPDVPVEFATELARRKIINQDTIVVFTKLPLAQLLKSIA